LKGFCGEWLGGSNLASQFFLALTFLLDQTLGVKIGLLPLDGMLWDCLGKNMAKENYSKCLKLLFVLKNAKKKRGKSIYRIGHFSG